MIENSTPSPGAALLPYVGSAPLCYTNTLVMTLDDPALQPSLIETLTSSAFGYQLLAGEMPFTDPFGWDPEEGIDQALRLLGYEWQTHHAANSSDAMDLLRAEVERQRPVFVGPLDMGLLAHQPGSDRATGADHYVAVLDVTEDTVWMHDPQGHPWAALPIEVFVEAWRADEIDYVPPFTYRSGVTRTLDVPTEDALRGMLPEAISWAQGRDLPVPPGTVGGAAALMEMADRCDQGLSDDLRDVLINFSLRLGARRRQDAATWLARIDEIEIATNLQQQARILGGLQYPTVTHQWSKVADGFRLLACTQADLTRNLAAR